MNSDHQCKKFNNSGVAELLAAMAAGWNARFIVEFWAHGSPIATSVGLAVAAHSTGARHVCVVPDEISRTEYTTTITRVTGALSMSPAPSEVVVGEAEAVTAELEEVDFLVVDSGKRDFTWALKVVRVSSRGAVLACKNAWQRSAWGFRWHVALRRGTRVVRTVFLPVGKGLDIAYIGSTNNSNNNNNGITVSSTSESVSCSSSKKGPSRWIKQVDMISGEEHVFRQ